LCEKFLQINTAAFIIHKVAKFIAGKWESVNHNINDSCMSKKIIIKQMVVVTYKK